METDTSTDGGSIHPQQNQFVGHNFQVVSRMQQAMPIMSQFSPEIPQQGQTPGTFDTQPDQPYVDMIPQQGQTLCTFDMQPGQYYVDMINKLFLVCHLFVSIF